MVFKREVRRNTKASKFENDVNMYGIQTQKPDIMSNFSFENDVNMYGIQTILPLLFSF